jgi:hypothetical protein
MCDVVALIGACVVGAELLGAALIDGVASAHRPLPRVAWHEAAGLMETGDLVVAYPGMRCRTVPVALVVRDVVGVVYAVTGARGVVPLLSWARRAVASGAQPCWMPLVTAGETRGAQHARVQAALRPRVGAIDTLVAAGILRSACSLELVNCNTGPSYQFMAGMALGDLPPDMAPARLAAAMV